MHIMSAHREGVATIEIDRPERRNALTRAMYRSMTEKILAAGGDERVRAFLITDNFWDFHRP